jgi:uncharacterized protein YciI
MMNICSYATQHTTCQTSTEKYNPQRTNHPRHFNTCKNLSQLVAYSGHMYMKKREEASEIMSTSEQSSVLFQGTQHILMQKINQI